MKSNHLTKKRSHVAWLTAFVMLLAGTLFVAAEEDEQSAKQQPYWQRDLPSSSCPGFSGNSYCHFPSPLVVDLTRDGKLEIVVATNRGHVLAYRHDGSLIWDRDLAAAFGMGRDQQRVSASPAAADIDADGRMEIVIGTGTTFHQECSQGGIIVLEHDGSLKNGWPFLTDDYSVPPKGCRDTVFSTPALGDLDKDGKLEIVFGSFDRRIYALNQSGQLVPGFPVQSNLYKRFGWDNLETRLADTIWSSPALADLDGDGFLDIVIGTDEGMFDGRFPGATVPWNCPYREPGIDGYCGGSIYALNRFGTILPGFPRYELETFQSAPALVDVNDDGRSEIFVGSGGYYNLASPDHPRYGERIFGIASDGSDLPGWRGGKQVGGVVLASPALGDIDGDGLPEIVVPARDQKLYAYELNGSPVPGFPMKPKVSDGRTLTAYAQGMSAVLADYTGDGKMEIFLNHSWETIIIDGKGQHLTSSYVGDPRPFYLSSGTYWNAPAIGDLDGDGRLEMVTQNSKLTVWKLPESSSRSDWPMFRKDPARTGDTPAEFEAAPESFVVVHNRGTIGHYSRQLYLSSYLGSFEWTVSSDIPDIIKFPVKSGIVSGEQKVDFGLRLPSELKAGSQNIGNVRLTISKNGNVLEEVEMPVEVTVFANLHQAFLPSLP